jgi:acyl-[acyl-carrier-protein] desaturase
MTMTAPVLDRPEVHVQALDILAELQPVAAAQLDRHLRVAKEWMPHRYVPWSQGRDFDDVEWDPAQSRLSEVAQIAFEINLLTEDNLPSYHREIVRAFGRDGAWGTWVGQWTAEEGRHAMAMRDYLLVTRGTDPDALERGRMQQMQHGYFADEKDALRALAYVSFQELATRISHRNLGSYTEDPLAERLMARIAADENLHMIFYRDLVSAALQLDPSATIRAIAAELMAFAMPGTGISNFEAKAKQIAKAGIYDLRIHHDEVVMPLLKKWDFFAVEGLDGEAEQAREQVAGFLDGLDALAKHYEEKRAAAA